MSDPTRLVNDGSRLGKAVLASARSETAPADLRGKIHAAVLLGAVGTGLGAASTATAATKTSSLLASLTVAKCVGVVAVGVVATVGVQALVRTPDAGAGRAAVVNVAATPQSRPRVPRSTVPPVRVVAPDPAEPQPSGVPTAARVLAPTSPAMPARERSAPEGDEFTREVASVDSARGALASGDLDTAIERLNRHDLDFAHGPLRPEALAIRIQVYAAKHDAARVRELAGRFLADYPGHPFAARVPAIVEEMGGANP